MEKSAVPHFKEKLLSTPIFGEVCIESGAITHAPESRNTCLVRKAFAITHQVDRLMKIGKEGLSLSDEMRSRPRVPPFTSRNKFQYGRRGPLVITVQELAIDSNVAAQVDGGNLVVDYWIGKPIPRANN